MVGPSHRSHHADTDGAVFLGGIGRPLVAKRPPDNTAHRGLVHQTGTHLCRRHRIGATTPVDGIPQLFNVGAKRRPGKDLPELCARLIDSLAYAA